MTDLDKLIDAVEVGREPRTFWLCLGDQRNIDNAQMAFHGSLDAALRLHEALLPGWFWEITPYGSVHISKQAGGPGSGSGAASIPARSWLLAILRAIKAKGDA